MKKLIKKIEKLKEAEKVININNIKNVVKKMVSKYNDKKSLKIESIIEFGKETNYVNIILNDNIKEERISFLMEQMDGLNNTNDIIKIIPNGIEDVEKYLLLEDLKSDLSFYSSIAKPKKAEIYYKNYCNVKINFINKNINLISTDFGDFISDENNIYKKITDKSLQSLVEKNYSKKIKTDEETREIVKRIKKEGFISNITWDNVNKNEEMIFNNCIYNYVKNHTRKIKLTDYVITYIDTKFERIENAKPKKFSKFINEALQLEQQKLVQEYFGYSLSLKNLYKNFIIFTGVRDSGKSTISGIACKLIGDNNVSSVRPSELKSREKCYSLKNSIINMVPELEKGEKINDDIKKITSGGSDSVKIRALYCEPEQIYPRCKTWLVSNWKPIFEDDSSGAISSRMLWVDFKKSVSDKNKNINLVDEVVEEEGNEVINWAIDGLIRLNRRKKFTRTVESEIENFERKKKMDMFFNFLVENINDFKSTNHILFKELFDKYITWLEDENFRYTPSTVKFRDNINFLNIEVLKDTRKFEKNGEPRGTYILLNSIVEEIENTLKIVNRLKEEEEKEELLLEQELSGNLYFNTERPY